MERESVHCHSDDSVKNHSNPMAQNDHTYTRKEHGSMEDFREEQIEEAMEENSTEKPVSSLPGSWYAGSMFATILLMLTYEMYHELDGETYEDSSSAKDDFRIGLLYVKKAVGPAAPYVILGLLVLLFACLAMAKLAA